MFQYLIKSKMWLYLLNILFNLTVIFFNIYKKGNICLRAVQYHDKLHIVWCLISTVSLITILTFISYHWNHRCWGLNFLGLIWQLHKLCLTAMIDHLFIEKNSANKNAVKLLLTRWYYTPNLTILVLCTYVALIVMATLSSKRLTVCISWKSRW